MGLRRVLSSALAYLSKWAIVKHGMKFIVVAGEHGTKLTGELVAEMLTPDYVIRRQLERPFWDFSIPLTILGFEDRQYSFFEWIVVLSQATLLLIFGKRNFTWTLLQMSTFKKDIVGYWSKIITPEVLVLVNSSPEVEKLESTLVRKTRRLVVVPEDVSKHPAFKMNLTSDVIVVGDSEECDLVVDNIEEEKMGTRVSVRWLPENEKTSFFAFQKGSFLKEPLVLAIGVLLGMEFSVEEVSDRLMQSQIEVERFILSAH